MSIYIHYYPKVSTGLVKLIYYNSQIKPHESEGTDHASSQRLKRDPRARKVTTVGQDGAQGIFYKVLRGSKSGRMSRDRGADPRASTGCQAPKAKFDLQSEDIYYLHCRSIYITRTESKHLQMSKVHLVQGQT